MKLRETMWQLCKLACYFDGFFIRDFRNGQCLFFEAEVLYFKNGVSFSKSWYGHTYLKQRFYMAFDTSRIVFRFRICGNGQTYFLKRRFFLVFGN